MHSTELRKQFIQLRAQGKTIRAAAQELSIAHSTATAWNGIYHHEIAWAYRDQFEEAIDALAASRLQRVRVLARSFKQVENYLRTAEPSIRTNIKAYDLLIRLDKHLARELAPDAPPASLAAPPSGTPDSEEELLKPNEPSPAP